MKHMMVRYRLKPGSVVRVMDALRDFIRSVREEEPGTLLYLVHQDPHDELMFTHLMVFKDSSALSSHRNTTHLMSFLDELYPSCDEGPILTEILL